MNYISAILVFFKLSMLSTHVTGLTAFGLVLAAVLIVMDWQCCCIAANNYYVHSITVLFCAPGTFGGIEDNAAELPEMENDYARSDIDSYAQAQLAREYEAAREEQAILSQLSDSPPGNDVTLSN